MKPEEALEVAINCVVKVGKHDDVQPDSILKKVGFPEASRIEFLKDEIVDGDEVGVPSKQHKIKRAALDDMGPDSSVFEVSDMIEKKAVPDLG
jgi:hypothetical protein